jgi:hypothetical protein
MSIEGLITSNRNSISRDSVRTFKEIWSQSRVAFISAGPSCGRSFADRYRIEPGDWLRAKGVLV